MLKTFDYRDCAAAEAHHRAANPTAAGPMVPRGLDGEREQLRTGLRQGAGRWASPRGCIGHSLASELRAECIGSRSV